MYNKNWAGGLGFNWRPSFYNTRQNLETLVFVSTSPKLIWVLQSSQCSKIRVAQHWGRRGAHLIANKRAKSECKKFSTKFNTNGVCFNDLWRWRQRRTSKKALDLLGKITILPGHHGFCYISLLSPCIWAQLPAAAREISPPSERAAEIEPTVYTTRTLHFLFLHSVKDINRRRRFSLSFNFLSLITALMNSTLVKFANMIIWMRWNYSDEVRNSTISKWPFRALLSPW